MAFISLFEIFDIVVMSLAIGFIFKDIFKKLNINHSRKSSFFEDMKLSVMIAAPAIVLHELAHKFVAMGFGAEATLHAPYGMYLIVILLKLVHFPLFFIVGGYVSHNITAALPSALIALAGPLINFLIWGCLVFVMNYMLVNKKKYYNILFPMARLNLFLAAFNMLPIPGFDGFHFFGNIYHVLF